MTPDEFLQQHGGEMTPELAAQLLELGDMGDTGTQPDEGGEPNAAPVTDEGTPGATDDNAGKPDTNDEPEDPANAVVLAKDGKHTIPFEKLVEAREARKTAEAALAAANTELESLRAAAQERADAGIAPTTADKNLAIAEQAVEQGFDPGLFGDFSEEAIAKGVQTLVDQRVGAAVAKALEPYQAKQTEDATEQHFKTIFEKHPDADSLAESKELADWIASQPSFARAGYQAVLEQGTATEVVELFDTFKSSTGKTQPAAAAQDLKARAKAAVASAKPAVPASLSDIPGGTPGPASKFEALDQMNPAARVEALEAMSQADRERWFETQM